jgi:hypothetical protein
MRHAYILPARLSYGPAVPPTRAIAARLIHPNLAEEGERDRQLTVTATGLESLESA